MNFIDLYFNPSGRINRSTYWLFGVLLLSVGWWVIYSLLFVFFLISIGLSGLDDLSDIEYILANAVIFVLIFVIALLMNFWNFYAIVVKRLHDRNKSAWWVLFWYLIALLGLPLTLGIATLAVWIWALIELGFLEGGLGTNSYGYATTGPYAGRPSPQRTRYGGAPAGAYLGDPGMQGTQYGRAPARAYQAGPGSQRIPYGAAPAGPYPNDPVPQDTPYDATPAGPYPSDPVPQDTPYDATPAGPYPSDPVPQDTPYDAAPAGPYPSDPVSLDISDDAAPGSAHVEDAVPQDTPYDAAPAETPPVSPDQQNRSSQQRAASPPTLVAQQAEPAPDFDAPLNQTPASPSTVENNRDGFKSFYESLDAEGDAGKLGGLYSLIQSRIGNAGVVVAGIVFAAFSVFARTDIFGSMLDYISILGIVLGIAVVFVGVFMLGREKEWWGRIGALGINAGNNGTQTARRTKICPYCAEEIMFEAIRCRFCGSDLPPDASAS